VALPRTGKIKGKRPLDQEKKKKGKGRRLAGRFYENVPLARIEAPLLIWYWVPEGYWFAPVPSAARIRSPAAQAVAPCAIGMYLTPFVSVSRVNIDFEDIRVAPLPEIKVNVVEFWLSPVGTLVNVMIQFVPSLERVTPAPMAFGVLPGPEINPDTMTYSTAASTTVIATIKIVAMTGDTAFSSFRRMVFIFDSP
jgi:hypothetical protein